MVKTTNQITFDQMCCDVLCVIVQDGRTKNPGSLTFWMLHFTENHPETGHIFLTRRQWWFNIEGRGKFTISIAWLVISPMAGKIGVPKIFEDFPAMGLMTGGWDDRTSLSLEIHRFSVHLRDGTPPNLPCLSRRFLTSPVVEADAKPGATWSRMVDDELIVVQCHSFLASESYDHSYWKTNVKMNESYESLLSSS